MALETEEIDQSTSGEIIMPSEVAMFLIDRNDYFVVNDSDFNLSSDLKQLWNTSGGLNLDLILKFERNLRLGGALLAALLLVYGAVITIGVAGNSLVVLAVVKKPAMPKARNVFIINLAISDLVLCLATMPLTLLEILSQYWPLGNTPFLCKLVGTLQATSIFVSTISITAIALDRYHVILHPTQRSLGTSGALFVLPGIWASALFLAMPQFLFRTLSHHVINLPGVDAVDFCFEEWPVEHGRAYYSVFVMLVQFFVPLLTVTVSYAMIAHKLKCRMLSSSVRGNPNLRKDESRNKKTNVLLMTIAIIFCLSWLPLNLYNIILDFTNPFGEDTDTMLTVYAVCHLLGMSSACSNPILYGWFNNNFRKKFKEILRVVPCCKCLFEEDSISSPRTRILSIGPETQEELEPDEGTNFKPFEQIMMNDITSPKNGISRDGIAADNMPNLKESEVDKLIFTATTL
ncbi:G protein-coupled receptor rhodopsin-like [Trinorchestia longiramus]|nr:G protein-coupled receptor rhodopsin-like [Trinorchestia longiramus]